MPFGFYKYEQESGQRYRLQDIVNGVTIKGLVVLRVAGDKDNFAVDSSLQCSTKLYAIHAGHSIITISGLTIAASKPLQAFAGLVSHPWIMISGIMS